ncbi:hypothetical protein GCM10022271_22270 [Corallibacter vietnamensis]|uniref:Secretion system C-terminal sorting domain-containing protein n=1 Tax=Corallibacter vietnamensis TaxID=904130 RepID=A0ABP7HD24_9FLAO
MRKTLLFILTLFTVNSTYSQVTELWGMTSNGGADYLGTVYKLDETANNFSLEHTFDKNIYETSPLSSLVRANNDKLYGVARNNLNNASIIYSYDIVTQAYTVLHDIGTSTEGDLTLASNGKLYGVTTSGGDNNFGVIFEFDINTNTFTEKVSISNSRYNGSLVEDSSGKLYGMSRFGGSSNVGVIYEYDIQANTLVTKYEFNGTNGANPYSGLLYHNSKLYGMTSSGGINGLGVLFEYDLQLDTYTKKLDFDGVNNGANPYGSLSHNSNKLYGLTRSGGINSEGVMFEFDINTDAYTKLVDFDSATTGSSPYTNLLLASNNKLYGMTRYGGSNNFGVLFEYDIALSSYAVKFEFFNGKHPGIIKLLEATNGKLYGTLPSSNYSGVLFEFDYNTNNFLEKIEFNNNDGATPSSDLVQASNGYLYGLTSSGGAFNDGVIFEIDPVTNVYTKKVDLENINTGQQSTKSGFILADNDLLYGVANNGGTNGYGTLFEYNPSTNVYTKKIDFDQANTGAYPSANLLQASNGKLYGTTYSGGTNGYGVLFEFEISTDTYTKLLDFDGINKGSNPQGTLLQASNGKIYGTTYSGGTRGYGVIFEYDITNSSYTKLLDVASTFRKPQGNLVEVSGKIYGTNSRYSSSLWGNTSYSGAKLFEYDYNTNTITSVFSQSYDRLSLYLSPIVLNGKLYLTGSRNYNGGFGGYIYEYDTNTNTSAVKHEFTTSLNENGYTPNGGLTLVTLPELLSVNDTNINNRLAIYPNPVKEKLFIKGLDASSTYNLYNITGQFLGSGNLSKSHNSINVQHLNKGIFMIEIINASTKSKQTFKVIKN